MASRFTGASNFIRQRCWNCERRWRFSDDHALDNKRADEKDRVAPGGLSPAAPTDPNVRN